jgi:hypothetical protein
MIRFLYTYYYSHIRIDNILYPIYCVIRTLFNGITTIWDDVLILHLPYYYYPIESNVFVI